VVCQPPHPNWARASLLLAQSSSASPAALGAALGAFLDRIPSLVAALPAPKVGRSARSFE